MKRPTVDDLIAQIETARGNVSQVARCPKQKAVFDPPGPLLIYWTLQDD